MFSAAGYFSAAGCVSALRVDDTFRGHMLDVTAPKYDTYLAGGFNSGAPYSELVTDSLFVAVVKASSKSRGVLPLIYCCGSDELMHFDATGERERE